MDNLDKLLAHRQAQLLDQGYPPGVVGISIQWALASAEGQAAYFSNNGELFGCFLSQLLPHYLEKAECYLKGVGAPRS